MSRTYPCLDQGVMVFCKTRTVGNEGLLQGPMLCPSKGFLQEVGIILKLCGTFRFQRHRHSSKSDLIWPCNNTCFKLEIANECLNSKFDILTNGIFKQQLSSW